MTITSSIAKGKQLLKVNIKLNELEEQLRLAIEAFVRT